jgi:YggT family protein
VQSYLVNIIQLVVTLVSLLLIANALISFAPLEPWHPVRRTLNQLAEPILRPFRSVLPNTGPIDFSPMIALIVIQILGQILIVLVRSAF